MSANREAREWIAPKKAPKKQEEPSEPKKNQNDGAPKKKGWVFGHRWALYGVVMLTLLVILGASTFHLEFSNPPQRSQLCYPGGGCIPQSSKAAVFLDYAQNNETYLGGLVISENSSYSVSAELFPYPENMTADLSRFVYYISYVLVMPLNGTNSEFTYLASTSSAVLSRPLVLNLNLTDLQSTGQEIIDRQGISGSVILDVYVKVFYQAPASSNQTAALSKEIGTLGYDTQEGNWISMQGMNLHGIPIMVIS